MTEDGEAQGLRIIAENVYDLATIRKRCARSGCKLACNGNAAAATLAEILAPFRPGDKPIIVAYRNDRVGGDIELSRRLARQPRRCADRPAARVARAGERAGRVLMKHPPTSLRSAPQWRVNPMRLPDCMRTLRFASPGRPTCCTLPKALRRSPRPAKC